MQPQALDCKPVGESGLLATLGQSIDESVNRRLICLWQAALAARIRGVVELTPAFVTLLVQFDPVKTDYQQVASALQRLDAKLGKGGKVTAAGKTVEIPVCYGGRFGEDMPAVCAHTGLSQEQVITLHSGRVYLIYMIGFLPAFPYLGGMDERLFTPRLQTPRVKIPAGSVGIGGEQTGIYPMESPGGWQLIGRTPLTLFDPQNALTPRYQAGDRIRFVPIDEPEYLRLSQTEPQRG